MLGAAPEKAARNTSGRRITAMAASPRRTSPGLLRSRSTRAMLFMALGDPHIDVIGDFGAAVAPEQDREPDSISPTSAGFDGVSELPQPRRELQQYIVAVQPGSLINGRDARFDSADLGDERFHPVGRADIAREVP